MNNFKRLIPVALLVLFLVFLLLARARLVEAPVMSLSEAGQKVPILMYHKVNPYPASGGYGLRVPPERFSWQMEYLRKRGFKTLSFNDLTDYWEKGAPLPPRPVIITFDDGYQDNYHFAYPILKANRFKATIFVVSGLVGKTNEWDTGVKAQPVNKLLTWEQIKEMEKGGIEFGAHTKSHADLSLIPPELAATEITLSKQALEKELGHPVLIFAYPYGHFNEAVEKEVAKAGFKAAVSTIVAKNPLQPENHFALKRLRVTGFTTRDDFIKMIED